MQIVINISDSIYKDLQLGIGVGVVLKLEDIVVLPKRHGRLIDADAFKRNVCTYQQTGCGDCKHSLCCPEDVPTIIEANGGDADAGSD